MKKIAIALALIAPLTADAGETERKQKAFQECRAAEGGVGYEMNCDHLLPLEDQVHQLRLHLRWLRIDLEELQAKQAWEARR